MTVSRRGFEPTVMSDGSLTRDAISIVATETLLKLVTNAVFPSGVTATPNARLLTYTERVVANLEKLGLLATRLRS